MTIKKANCFCGGEGKARVFKNPRPRHGKCKRGRGQMGAENVKEEGDLKEKAPGLLHSPDVRREWQESALTGGENVLKKHSKRPSRQIV